MSPFEVLGIYQSSRYYYPRLSLYCLYTACDVCAPSSWPSSSTVFRRNLQNELTVTMIGALIGAVIWVPRVNSRSLNFKRLHKIRIALPWVPSSSWFPATRLIKKRTSALTNASAAYTQAAQDLRPWKSIAMDPRAATRNPEEVKLSVPRYAHPCVTQYLILSEGIAMERRARRQEGEDLIFCNNGFSTSLPT